MQQKLLITSLNQLLVVSEFARIAKPKLLTMLDIPWNNKAHLTSCVGCDFVAQYKATKVVTGAGSITAYYGVSLKARNYYGWLNQIIGMNYPFSCVNESLVREYSNLLPISYKSLMKYANCVYSSVVESIKLELPNSMGLVFDGWSSGQGTHFVAIFASYMDG